MEASDPLRHFVGKICSVFTCPLNRDFKSENPAYYPQQVVNYFVGEVESVDERGIMLSQSGSGLKTYIFLHALVGIAEEKVVRQSATAKPVTPPKQPPSHLDVSSLERLTKKLGQDFGSKP